MRHEFRDGRWAAARAFLGALAGIVYASAFVWPSTQPAAEAQSASVEEGILHGRLWSADSTRLSLAGLRVVVRTAIATDSVEVDSSGRFVILMDVPDEGVDLSVDGGIAARFHAIRVHLDWHETRREVRIALIPTIWSIASGRYAGQLVPIDPAIALGGRGADGRFWSLSTRAPDVGVMPIGWPTADLPIPLAVRAPEWGRPLEGSDSASFWQIVHDLEHDLGMQMFRPIAWDDDSIVNGRVVVGLKPSLRAAGKTYITYNREGDLYDGVVFFRTATFARDPHIVAHELMHALGFGHTRAWESIMNPSSGRVAGPTVQDVAYAQLAVRLRRLQQSEMVRYGVEVAVRK